MPTASVLNHSYVPPSISSVPSRTFTLRVPRVGEAPCAGASMVRLWGSVPYDAASVCTPAPARRSVPAPRFTRMPVFATRPVSASVAAASATSNVAAPVPSPSKSPIWAAAVPV